MTLRKNSPRRLLTRLRVALLALVAIAAVTAPAASANSTPPLRSTLEMELEIFDLHLTTACGGQWVFANVSFVQERKLVFDADGVGAREVATMDGEITWFTRDSGKSYTSKLVNKTEIEYPEGIDLFAPAKVTVTVYHGNTFPVGIGLPGRGTVTYDAFVLVSGDEDELPYWDVLGDPTSMNARFAATMAENAQRICAALA
jgi:ABC-type transport system substrate-binding protein